MSAAAMWYAQNPGKGTTWTATGGTNRKYGGMGILFTGMASLTQQVQEIIK